MIALASTFDDERVTNPAAKLRDIGGGAILKSANLTSGCGPAHLAWIIAAIAAAAIAGAWFFQLVLGILPCPLCLEQRYAYYFIIPVAALLALMASRGASGNLVTAGFIALLLAALANAGLGTYHAGVEWGFWQGPTDCTGPMLDLGGGSLLESIKTVKVVRCDEVQWRFLGLSLAGYNVLISLLMAALAACALRCGIASRA